MKVREVVVLDTCCPSAVARDRRVAAITEVKLLSDESGLPVFGLFEGDSDLLVVADDMAQAVELFADHDPDCWSCYTQFVTADKLNEEL